jgi:hypothetical protein
MKHFAVLDSPSVKFSAVVISTGINVPQDELDEVAEELRKLHINGYVVFDLLTANGTKSRRFFSIKFDGESFPATRFQCVEPETSVREVSAKFLCDHLSEVDLSLLTPAMRFAVSRGIPV